MPLYHRGFQLVVGAVSASQYSVTITGRLAEAADVSVERHLKYAKETQRQLPKLGEELEDLWTSMRLFEVCRRTIYYIFFIPKQSFYHIPLPAEVTSSARHDARVGGGEPTL